MQEIDHYVVLGLPSGEEGLKLSLEDIRSAYKKKAKEIHPDKNPNDKNASRNFQQLSSSHEILVNPETRKDFDTIIRANIEKERERNQYNSKWQKLVSEKKRKINQLKSMRQKLLSEKERRRIQLYSKRQKLVSDLERRERRVDSAARERVEEERITRLFKEEVEQICAKHVECARSYTNEGIFPLKTPPEVSSNYTNIRRSHGGLLGAEFRKHEESILEKLRKKSSKLNQGSGFNSPDKTEPGCF